MTSKYTLLLCIAMSKPVIAVSMREHSFQINNESLPDPFLVYCAEITQTDNLLTAQYISFRMHFMSHRFPFKSAFIFSSYDALFSSSGCLWVCLLTSVCFCQCDNNCKLCS